MTKPKVRDARKGYAIHRPEPLLLFALCSGSHSDPAVDFWSFCTYFIFVNVDMYSDTYNERKYEITELI